MFKNEVCVVGGAGHVGLPLSIAFANSGLSTIVFDINKKALETINGGTMPFLEHGSEPVLKKVINKTLYTTDDIKQVASAQFVVVVIGTPVDEHLNPKFHDMKLFFEDLVKHMTDNQIVIIRSTVYPGTSKLIQKMLKKHNKTLEVCFCPERIAEGYAMEELYTLPQIVSGFSKESIDKTSALFNKLTKDIIVISPFEAELAKLFTNSWRYIQFATANQFYMIAQENGADFYNIYNAMTFNYPRTKNFPKPGFAAGPCLFKDTMQISAFTHNNFFLGHSAMLINEGLPEFVIKQIKRENPDLEEKTVGILGMAFKSESDDPRESLSFKLKKLLEVESLKVLCSDEFIKRPDFVSSEEIIKECDILVIGTPHKKYAKIDFSKSKVYDVWNIIKT